METLSPSDATHQDPSDDAIDGGAERAILRALRGLRFGSVEITVHDGRVVQVERKERLRLRTGNKDQAR